MSTIFPISIELIENAQLDLGSPYTTAIKNKTIESRLFGGYGDVKYKKIREFIEDQNDESTKSFAASCLSYQELIDVKEIEPGKEYAASNYFVDKGIVDILFEKIIKYSKEPSQKKNIAFIGNKGSGKTLTQNILFSKYSEELNNENIFWIRCDCNHLYSIWKTWEYRYSTPYRLEIDDFIKINMVYNLAKYCPQTSVGIYGKIWKLIEDATYREVVGRELNKHVTVNIQSKLQKIWEIITHSEGIRKSSNPRYTYMDELILISRDTKRKAMQQWLDLADTISGLLLKSGFYLLHVVDGADNIHITKSECRPNYIAMITQLGKFLVGAPSKNIIKLAAFRERTYYDARYYQSISSSLDEHIDCREIWIAPAKHAEISAKRTEFLTSNGLLSVSNIFTLILNAVNKLSNEIPEWKYHYNNRCYLHNILTLMRQVYYRNLQKNKGHIPSSDELIAMTHSMWIRNYILNDRLFVDTQIEYPVIDQESGVCAMNLFYLSGELSTGIDHSTWHGLCSTRILQYLAQNGETREEFVINNLHSWFFYPEEFISSQITWFRAVGMIDSKINGKSVFLEITDSGRSFLCDSHTEVDLLYYTSLDTPLPSSFINRRFVFPHSNRLSEPSGYRLAAISSSISFLMFLVSISNREQHKIKGKIGFDPSLPIQTPDGIKKYEESVQRLGRLSSQEEAEIDAIFKFIKV